MRMSSIETNGLYWANIKSDERGLHNLKNATRL